MFWTLAATLVVALAVLQLLLWVVLYVAGDIKDALRRPGRTMPRPRFDVLIRVTQSDGPFLEECLASVYASTQKPSQVLLSASGGAYKKAVYLRRKYAYKNLRVFKCAPVESLVKNARQPTVVLLNGAIILDKSALGKGMAYFQNRKIKIIAAGVAPRPGSSVIRGLLALRRIVGLHAARPFEQKNAIKSQKFVMFRRRLFSKLVQANAPLCSDIYAYQSARLTTGTIFLRQSGIFWPVVTLVWAVAAGVVLYTYGLERGMILLYFAGGVAWLLAGVAVFSYRGLSFADRISLFLLAPFAGAVQLINAVASILLATIKHSRLLALKLYRSPRRLGR